MQLGTQLLAAIVLVILSTLIHGTGIVWTARLLRLDNRELSEVIGMRRFALLIGFALCLFALHALEILLFACFYVLSGALDELEPALFYSASAYTTLGYGIDQFATEWRLVGAIEGLIGFLLLGWSTAAFVADFNKVLRS